MNKVYSLNCEHWSALCSLMLNKATLLQKPGKSSRYVYLLLPEYNEVWRLNTRFI